MYDKLKTIYRISFNVLNMFLFLFLFLQVKINKKKSNMPLSAEGVVNHCIEEATNYDNLARMFLGWASYL